jgi:two-component system phosphate regulon sensor histidine kinase PhoR
LITDDLGYVHMINPAATRLLHTTEERAIGKAFAEVVLHYRLIELWQSCQANGQEVVGAVEVGRGLFLQAFVSPIKQAGAHGFLVILQDLTQVRFLQTVRRDFISNLSHELRTPLAAVRAVVETLADGAVDDPVLARQFLSGAEREMDTMTQMIEELLELSRIESGQVPLRMEPVSVRELISTPLERLQTLAEKGDLQITVEIDDALPMVVADATRMQQVVGNLLHNAIKFTPSGGHLNIRAYEQAEEGAAPEVVVAVKDSGMGIPAEDLPRIFERFYKSDRARTRSQSGTGLGLAISRHIVEAHGGRIWVKSKEGRGSTFYFSIPISA